MFKIPWEVNSWWHAARLEVGSRHIGIVTRSSTWSAASINLNQRTRCRFKIFLRLYGSISDKSCSCLKSSFGAVNTINKTLDLLLQFRDSMLNARRVIQQVVMILPMIGHVALKEVNPDVSFNVFQKTWPFLWGCSMIFFISIVSNQSLKITTSDFVPGERFDS